MDVNDESKVLGLFLFISFWVFGLMYACSYAQESAPARCQAVCQANDQVYISVDVDVFPPVCRCETKKQSIKQTLP